MHLHTYLLTIIWNNRTGDTVKRKEQKGHNESTELVLEIKSVLPFLLQEYILVLYFVYVPVDSDSVTRRLFFFFNYSTKKIWRQVYKLIQLHPTLTKLDASVDGDDDGDGNYNNNNNNNSLAFGWNKSQGGALK